MQLTVLDTYLEENRLLIDASAERLIESYTWETQLFKRAVSYSLSGGKRLRGITLLSVYKELSGMGDSEIASCPENFKKQCTLGCEVLPFALAVEMIHAYSLVHDDLPCMDDDDYRRGKPSCHKEFGEAVALLSGDALLTMAFEVMLACKGFPSEQILRAALEMAKAAGPRGMVGGQILDLRPGRSTHAPSTKTGRSSGGVGIRESWEKAREKICEALPKADLNDRSKAYRSVRNMYEMKTGALFECAAKAGAILAGAPDAKVGFMASWGRWFGYAYQILDDIDDKDVGGKEELKNTLLKTMTLKQACLEAQDALMKSIAFAQKTCLVQPFVEHLSCFYLSRVSQILKTL